MKYRIIIASMVFCCFGIVIVNHFRYDIFTIPTGYYVLESDTTNLGKKSRSLTVLLSNAPYLENNIKKCLEESFWEHLTLDTLHFYNSYYVHFFRETKYLTRNFKEGGQYNPEFSSWDNTMDWRNHYKDDLGTIIFIKREDGTGFYSITINDTGYGFQMFIDIVKSDITYQDFNDIRALYIRKCEELGIKKNDMEDDEEY